MRFVPINSVKEGTYLAKTLFDKEGRILLKKGVKLTSGIIKRIRNNKIQSVYINDDYSNNEIEDIIKPELRQKSIITVKKFFENYKEYNIQSLLYVSKHKATELRKAQDQYLKSIGDIAKTIIDEILSKKDVMINLVDIKSFDNYTYQHSVNVAVLSLVLGIELKLNKSQLYDLCVGGLLHDIGKILIPQEILLKKGKLTENEFMVVKQHTLKGYDYLKHNLNIPAPARIIVLQHHERINKEGYPNSLEGKEINQLAKIVAIADVYDALTSDRPYRPAMSPNEALELIMGSGGTQFDYEMVKIFARKITPYPIGTLVKLSNKDIAVVEDINPDMPLRPLVKIVMSNNKNNINKKIDLLNEINIVIVGIQYEMPYEI